jgi:hypothetical protein
MTHLIDKDALVAEIERLRKNQSLDDRHGQGVLDGLHSLEKFIDTLEVKEVDLDKEIDNIWNPRFNLGWDEKSLLSMNHEGFTTIAKHFFELGLKTQKGEYYEAH